MGNSIKKYLNNNKFDVKLALNSQDALSIADKNKPAAIVLELAIPRNNGIEFIQEFRSYSDWISIPIVVYSHIPQEDIGLNNKEWLSYGVHEYLYKPTKSLKNLTSALQDIVKP